MTGTIFVLGGARSGKSAFAEGLAASSGLDKIYLATGAAHDAEMAGRIAAHQARRDGGWRTVEEQLDVAGALRREARAGHVVLVDCLTLWLSNRMLAGMDTAPALDELDTALREADGLVILVSNEVGLSIVPDNALARAFRDQSGRMNQRVAAVADEAYFVAAGLPLKLKG